MATRRDGTGRGLNPLWIISAFLGLAETIAGIAATTADGWIGGLFAVFAVVFPAGVATAFFAILWKKPFVLYAPRDYARPPKIGEFVDAITPRSPIVNALEGAVRRSVESALPANEPNRAAVVERVVEQATSEFLDESVTIRVGAFSDDPGAWVRVFLSPATTVQDFLDQVYFALAPRVPPYTYGKRWLLADPATGRRFTELGAAWARAHEAAADDRRVLDAGITPGQTLEAVAA